MKYHPRLICSVNLNRSFHPSLEFRNERDDIAMSRMSEILEVELHQAISEELASGKLRVGELENHMFL